MRKNVNVSGGVSTTGLLGIVFIVLKLTGYIDWSWLWVLSPFWLPALIVLTIGGIFLTVLFFNQRSIKRDRRL